MGTLDWGGPPRNDIKLAPKAVLSKGNGMDRDETKHSSVEGKCWFNPSIIWM